MASRPNLLQLAGWSLGAVAAGVGLGFVLGSNLGWAEDGRVLRSAVFGGISVACGSAAAVVILGFLLSLPTVALAMGVVGAGVVRMIGSLMVGLGVFFATNPEGKTFWAAFLAANLMALVVESMWGIVNNKSGAAIAATVTAGASE
ncbi:MAG: hypothetical protein ACOYN0_18745 [Phycisphaerales bacterium]